MSELHVACAAEGEAYVAHSAAMLHSVVANAGALDVRVHYLHSPRFEPAWRDKLASVASGIEFHEIADDRVADLREQEPFTRAMWFRIFLPELLPAEPRVLYLDVDTLAVDSLEPLWRTDLADDYVGAVTNVLQHDHLHRPAELGLADAESYFNSGVLLINLEAWRRDGIAERLHDYAVRNAEWLAWPDQDALNVVLGARRTRLHPRWNAMNSVLEWDSAKDVLPPDQVDEARRSPAIRHFEGPSVNKPWHYACRREHRDLYFEHRRATPWPKVAIEGRTPLRMLRRRLSA
jgi:lipopolysaccharide biosynthesis glycosyltransferase